MSKCQLCQQIYINLKNIYSYRIKSLAQTVLRLKGFKDSLDINKTLVLCENCKQGIENVALFWENIPEAKQGIINNSDYLESAEEQNVKISSAEEFQNVKHNFTSIALMATEEQENEVASPSLADKLQPIKINIKLPRKRKNKKILPSVAPDFATDSSHKRIKRVPKRFEDFHVSAIDKTLHSFEENPLSSEECKEMCFNTLAEIALLRLSNGQVIGKLAESESKGMSTKLRISCQICSQVVRSEKTFRKHFESHNTSELQESLDDLNDYMFYCQLCDKSFNQHYAVRRHYRFAHSEERPFKCQHCEANFKYKFNLDYHMCKHIPKHRFECTFCKKMFVMRYELKIHLRTHTKERPYKCELCPMAFAHKSNLKTHQKVKHPSNHTYLQDSFNTEKISLSKEQFKPPEILLERTDLSEQNISDSTILPTFESFTKNLRNENIEIITQETKNSLETVIEYDCKQEEKNYQIVRAKHTNQNCADQLKLQPKIGVFQLDSSILKVLPSVTVLGLKKWPKYFQNSLDEQLQVFKKLNENSNLFDINQFGGSYNESRQDPITMHMPADSNTSTDILKSERKDTNCTENSYTECGESSEYETAHDISNSSGFVANRNSTIFSNLKIENVQDSCDTNDSGKFINISKSSKDHFSDIKPVQIQSSSNESLGINSNDARNSMSWKEIKVSTRPVKLKHFLNCKSSLQNSFKNSESVVNNDDSTSKISQEIVQNMPLTPLTTTAPNKEINNQIPHNSSKNFTNYTHVASQSLLKPVLKNRQISGLSLTNSVPNQIISNTKPVITKVEILPPLKTLPTIQNAFLTAAPTNIIKPPPEYKFQCPYCYKYFKQKSPLNKHLRTHTGDKPYKCNLCPKSYSDPSNYKKHKILHKNAAESLNITRKTAYATQSSPAYSTVSDPDPDGIEVMQTLKKFECSSTEDDDIDDEATTSSNKETQMWHNALEHALNSEEIRENIRNLVGINNVILPKSMQQITNEIVSNKNFSTEDPD